MCVCCCCCCGLLVWECVGWKWWGGSVSGDAGGDSICTNSALVTQGCRDPEAFDWYQRYSGLSELLSRYVKRADSILMCGCGTSRLSEEMYDAGYTAIANIDIAPAAIAIMSAKTRGKEGMTWATMDTCALTFPDAYFDAVLDKGTMDSVLCGENSTANAAKMCAEVSRTLKPGGNFVVISYGQPESRLSYLEKEEYKWRVTVHTIRTSFFLLHVSCCCCCCCFCCSCCCFLLLLSVAVVVGLEPCAVQQHHPHRAPACAAKPTIAGAPAPDAADPTAVHYVYICHRTA